MGTSEAQIKDLDSFLKGRGVKHFTAAEVARPFAISGPVANEFPKRDIWWHIVPTLRVLDRLRDRLNQGIVVTSGYRAPAYNNEVGGARKSLHVQFNAIDFRVEGLAPHKVIGVLYEVLGDGFLEGICGMGRYSTFVHFDTRGLISDMKGASWG